ncbi:hypothetical protein AB1Y20_007319 [Prymnesium parvum]|uniref:Uncharacterized protein n=1 Tax=Prymnesium parvum TaxID=97485 RepID=A0AB34IUM6_PRYPA
MAGPVSRALLSPIYATDLQQLACSCPSFPTKSFPPWLWCCAEAADLPPHEAHPTDGARSRPESPPLAHPLLNEAGESTAGRSGHRASVSGKQVVSLGQVLSKPRSRSVLEQQQCALCACALRPDGASEAAVCAQCASAQPGGARAPRVRWRAPLAEVWQTATSAQLASVAELFFSSLEFARNKGDVLKEEAAMMAASGRSAEKKEPQPPRTPFISMDLTNLVRERVDSDDW